MNMYDIIENKRDGKKLTKGEIDFFVNGYSNESIPDYQASALLMAIFFSKMDAEETFDMTNAMKNSGDIIDLSQIQGTKVDKHSTGGVGDKTTLIVAPIAAAAGVPIAKMSGRGLGFTGGTIDKLESIPNFQTSIDQNDFINLVNRIGISVIGQTAKIAIADKKIYALRDVTATVDNISLIASSIMSKKLASGSDAIVLDVKCGSGAFMDTEDKAVNLGNLMVEMGKIAGKNTIAVITDMDQPLGNAVGNSLEVIEAIETLKGNGPKDITHLSIYLAGLMIFVGGKAISMEDGIEKANELLNNGKALEKFKEFVEGQKGDIDVIDDYSLFKQPKAKTTVISKKEGYINKIITDKIGMISQHTGAGRITKEDSIDLSAGIILNKKVGDYVNKGDCLATLFGEEERKLIACSEDFEKAIIFSNYKPITKNIIKKIIK